MSDTKKVTKKPQVASVKYTKYIMGNIDELNKYLSLGLNHQAIADRFNEKLASENLASNLTHHNISQIITRMKKRKIKAVELVTNDFVEDVPQVIKEEQLIDIKPIPEKPVNDVKQELSKPTQFKNQQSLPTWEVD